jgi:hypothetical protein
MPSATAITLTDASAVDFIYTPQSTSAKLSLFDNDAATSSAGRSDFSLGLSRATSNRTSDHVDIKLRFPFEHTVDGVVKVSHTALITAKFVLPQEMSAVDRENVLAKVRDLLSDSVITSYVKDLQPVY